MSKSAMPYTTAGFLSAVQIDFLLAQPILARLATVNRDQPHVVPMWFLWEDEALYMVTDVNFHKAHNLRRNPKCAVTIDDSLGGLRLWGIMMDGEAELITLPLEYAIDMKRQIFTKYLGVEGIMAPTPTRQLTEASPVIIKLTPRRIVTWDDTHSAIAPIG